MTQEDYSNAVNIIKNDLRQVLIERGHDPYGVWLDDSGGQHAPVSRAVNIIAEAIQSGRSGAYE